MKKIPVGVSDFEELIINDFYYIDKSLLVKEILDHSFKATLIPRPRRFGKTLNMSMLRYFFEKSEQSKQHLFSNLKISNHPDCMQHQGQYPVIFISLKDAKALTWSDCYKIIAGYLQEEFTRHAYLLQSEALNATQRQSFTSVMEGSADAITFRSALKDLCHYLAMHYKTKVVVLIDEYDSPIHAGFINKYYDQVTDFMRGLLGAGLKDNADLNFSVLTGILRIAKESIFSGLNHLDVCTLLSNDYTDKFGLLEHEVAQFLTDCNLSPEIAAVKEWYNGYSVGDNRATVYNPWSIINFVAKEGVFQPYWINTSDNAIVKELIIKSPAAIKKELELLLEGHSVEKKIDESISFSTLHSSEESVWSFLLLTGYLSYDSTRLEEGVRFASLRLPNQEVSSFYKTTILNWVENSLHIDTYHCMLQSLVTGNIEEFKTIFYDTVLTSLSSFDTAGNEPERFYHGLILGMLISLREDYTVTSNRESGYGRYDVMIVPRNPQKNHVGIIIEFKKKNSSNPTLEHATQAALAQIEARAYETQLRDAGVQTIIKLAIAFDGKQALVVQG